MDSISQLIASYQPTTARAADLLYGCQFVMKQLSPDIAAATTTTTAATTAVLLYSVALTT